MQRVTLRIRTIDSTSTNNILLQSESAKLEPLLCILLMREDLGLTTPGNPVSAGGAERLERASSLERFTGRAPHLEQDRGAMMWLSMLEYAGMLECFTKTLTQLTPPQSRTAIKEAKRYSPTRVEAR